MAILVNKSSRVLVQGITGGNGMYHTERMIAYGTNIVGGVTPGKDRGSPGTLPRAGRVRGHTCARVACPLPRCTLAPLLPRTSPQ